MSTEPGQRAEQLEQELYAMYMKNADLYARAGELWSKQDGKQVDANSAFELAAECCENAANLMSKAIRTRRIALDMIVDEIEETVENDE